jgi:hypothetical protein
LEDDQLFLAVDRGDDAGAPGADPVLGFGGLVFGAAGLFGLPDLFAGLDVEAEDEAAGAGADVEVDAARRG